LKIDLNSLPIEQKVGQLFFIGIPGPEIDDATERLLHTVMPGGICLFARNIKVREQTRKLLDDLSSRFPVAPLLSVDQEGGLVDRLRRIMTPMPAAGSLRTANDARQLGSIVGESLSVLGFNMDFAPVVDVVTPERGEHSNGLYNRPFGTSKESVVEFASAFSNGLHDNGILNCLKHFPGYGATKVDSHEELPFVEVSDDELQEVDLMPYREMLPDADAVMVGHTVFPRSSLQEVDESGKLLPSSLSKAFITTLLREQLGYDGLVVSDDLEMGAIIKNYGVGDACKTAVKAGSDMLAICADPERITAGFRAVLAAVGAGEISEARIDESLGRIAEAKTRTSLPPPFDNARLDELSAQTAELVSRLG
jgi:beta-N-acetylhexosaminidase